MENNPCRSCKIISICCPVAIGTYLIYTGKSYEKKSKIIMNVLGLGRTNILKLTTHLYIQFILGTIGLGLAQIGNTKISR